MNDEIRDGILQALMRVAPEVESLDELDPDDDLREQVDIDSVDFLNFVTALHERFGVDIPERDYKQLGSISAVVAYLAERSD